MQFYGLGSFGILRFKVDLKSRFLDGEHPPAKLRSHLVDHSAKVLLLFELTFVSSETSIHQAPLIESNFMELISCFDEVGSYEIFDFWSNS